MRLKLSIARFEVSVPELNLAVEGFAQNRIKALESVVEDGRRVIADFLNQAMHAEMTLFLGKALGKIKKFTALRPSCLHTFPVKMSFYPASPSSLIKNTDPIAIISA